MSQESPISNIKLSVLIPNYNGERVLPQFFPSVLKAAESYDGKLEIIVVDDASTDSSLSYLTPLDRAGKIQLHSHEKNKGFSGACNTAARLAKGEVLFFLNTDVELPVHFFDYFEFYFKNPSFADKTFALTIHGKHFRSKSNLDGIKSVDWSRGQLRVTKNLYPEELSIQNLKANHLWPSFGVQGAYFFVSAEKFNQLGGFDERLNPFIFEETDLCYRALKRGWKIFFEPRCIAYHDHSTTLNSVASKKRQKFYSFRNRLLFSWKNIHDYHLIVSHCFFLLLKLLQFSPTIWKATFEAIKQAPSIYKSRLEEKRKSVLSDTELLRSFQHEYNKYPSWIKTLGPMLFMVFALCTQSLVCVYWYKSVNTFTLTSFLISLGFSIFFWLFVLELQKILPRWLKWVLTLGISVVFSFYFISQFIHFKMLGEFLTPFVLAYVVNDFHYLSDYIQKFLFQKEGLAVLILFFILFQIWNPNWALFYPKKIRFSPFSFVRLFLFLIIALVFQNQIKWETSGQVKFSDGALTSSIDLLFKDKKKRGLQVTIRKSVEPLSIQYTQNQYTENKINKLQTKNPNIRLQSTSAITHFNPNISYSRFNRGDENEIKDRDKNSKSNNFNKLDSNNRDSKENKLNIRAPDVFIFIGESWGKDKTSIYGYSKSTMPFLKEWIKSNKAVVFNKAYTNSSATDVSIPSLLTGVGTEESFEKFHKMPLLWDWARSAGYQTLFVSPQRMVFAHIDKFLKTPGPDLFIPGNAISHRIINDQGIDDILAVKKLYEVILQQDKNKPLLVIFFNNALHYPFLDSSSEVDNIPTELQSKYEKALYITDRTVEIALTALKERGQSENTFFLFTADHGEVETQIRSVPRVVSFYNEILEIPFIIKLPDSWSHCNEKLILNSKKSVQNLDVLPTVIDLLGYYSDKSSNQTLITDLRGHSLCKELPKERVLVHLNTNGIRQWSSEGFGLTLRNMKLIFSNLEGVFLFDNDKDPSNKVDVLSSYSNPNILQLFENKINSEYELKRIFGNRSLKNLKKIEASKKDSYTKHL